MGNVMSTPAVAGILDVFKHYWILVGEKVTSIGTSPQAPFFLGGCGVAAAVAVPPLALRSGHPEAVIYGWLSGMLALALHVVGAFVLKHHRWFRERRGFGGDLFFTGLATGLSVVTTILRQRTEMGMLAQLCVSLAIFSLNEVSRPRQDYGITQTFLRMPLQTYFLCLTKENVDNMFLFHGLWVGLCYIFLTAWNLYFARLFEEEEERNRVAAAAVARRQVEVVEIEAGAASGIGEIVEGGNQEVPEDEATV